MTKDQIRAVLQRASGGISLRQLGVAIGAHPNTPHTWVGRENIPAEWVGRLVCHSGEKVQPWDLRPDTWPEEFPWLIGTPGAPRVAKARLRALGMADKHARVALMSA